MVFGFDSDHQLIERALKGSERAWERLVRRYEKRMYNVALRLTRRPEDAMDLMQDVFLSVFRNLDRYRASGSFSGWLFRIANNRAVDLMRKRNPAEPNVDEPLLQAVSDDRCDQHQLLQQADHNQHILDMMQSLNADQRSVIELKFFQQMTFDEIAETLAISSNTAKSRCYAALKKLRPLMEVKYAM